MSKPEDLHMHQKLALEAFMLLSELLWGRHSLLPIQKWRAERRGASEKGRRGQPWQEAVASLKSWLRNQLPEDVFQVELFGYGYDYLVTMAKLPGNVFKGVIDFGNFIHLGGGCQMILHGHMLWAYAEGMVKPEGKIRVLGGVPRFSDDAEKNIERMY